MQKVMILFCAVLLAACTTLPRTTGELREGKGKSIGLSKQEVHNINRGFSLVVSDVRRKSMECLRFAYSSTTTHTGVHMSGGTRAYNVDVKTVGSGKAEMTMQWDRTPRASHDPAGGYYVFLADIENTAANKTRLTMYGASTDAWQAVFDAIKGWGEGKNVKCPEATPVLW